MTLQAKPAISRAPEGGSAGNHRLDPDLSGRGTQLALNRYMLVGQPELI